MIKIHMMILLGLPWIGACSSQRDSADTPVPEAIPDTLAYTVTTFERTQGDCDRGPCVSLILRYPEFTAGPPSVVDSVRAAIRTMILTSVFEGNPQPDAQALWDEIREAHRDIGYAAEWVIERQVNVLHNAQGLLTLALQDYAYTGGAHPNASTRYLNVDAVAVRVLSLEDVLIPAYAAPLDSAGERVFWSVRNLQPDERLQDAGFWFEEDAFHLTDNFAITEAGLLFYFNSYDIAPYAMGPTELLIPYTDISGLIRPDGPLVRIRQKNQAL